MVKIREATQAPATCPRHATHHLGEIRLANRPESVAAARSFVRLLATAWQAPHVIEDAELLTSELVTNAGQHVRGPHTAPLRVVAYGVGEVLRIEVHDAERQLPRARKADVNDENGRGLFLVEMIATRSGCFRTPTGKAVWFELHAWPDSAQRQNAS